METAGAQDLDLALRALADGSRRSILALVRASPRAVGEIAEEVSISQQAVSHHLRVLRTAGLVTERHEGTRHLFVVRTDGFAAVARYLDDFWPTRLSALKRAAEKRRRSAAAMPEYRMSVDIEAPPDIVFRHLVTVEGMVAWMGERAELHPVPGGDFAVDINGVAVRGSYLELDPPHRVVVSWGMAGSDDLPPGSSQVAFTLTPTEAGTRRELVHSGLPDTRMPGHTKGWAHYLARLQQAGAGQDPGPDPGFDPAVKAPQAARAPNEGRTYGS